MSGSLDFQEDPVLMRYYNDALIAIEIIYEVALAGSGYARQMLRDEAARLCDRAGRLKSIEKDC